MSARSGRFERHRDADGQEVFRLRWDDPAPLCDAELSRLAFVRHLVRTGRLSDSVEPPAG